MSSKPPQIFFFFLSGSKKGKIEASEAPVTRIGRQPYCEVKLDPYQDIPASGDHCHVIREVDGSYYLLDSGSTFGTYHNGTQIQGRVKLATGDVIECGKDVDGGRAGPRLKFYLDEDVRKCPICSGPVYKRHFRCPECRKKTCLRCIDFERKICRSCATAPARSAGFEVVEDQSVQAKRPAKVVVSGRDAKKVKRAQEKKAKEKDDKHDSLAAPYCLICQDFVKGTAFVCPACGREVCATHQRGKVCKPCAGVSSEPVAAKKTKAMPAQGSPVPPSDLVTQGRGQGLDQERVPGTGYQRGSRPPLSTPPPMPRTAIAPVPRTDDAAAPPTVRFRPGSATPGALPRKAVSPPSVKTGSAACARCHGPLGAGSFCCRSCRRIMCYAHVAVDDCCEDCYLAGRDRAARAATPAPQPRPSSLAQLPPNWDGEHVPTLSEIEALDMMPLLDTEKEEDRFDDDLARPPPGTSSEDGLIGLSFVCPHCDAPLDAAARACPRCRKVL